MSISHLFTAAELCGLRIPAAPAADERCWTPYDIMIMMHHHCSYSPFEHHDAPIYPERLKALIDSGLLAIDDEQKIPRSTPLGAALVEMWCQQPIPVAQYVDPRLIR